MIGCQFIYLFLIFTSATTLKPIVDKSEIGEGDDFTVTCDYSRVKTHELTQPIYMLVILRKYSNGSKFKIIMASSENGFYPRPEHVIWPWKPIFHFYNVSEPEDQYIALHNTNATCDDAGEYRCEVSFDWLNVPYVKTQLLRKKASCYKVTTETGPLPAETAYSGDHVTDSNPYTEPSTQSSGIQVVKGSGKRSFIVETILLIVVKVSVM